MRRSFLFAAACTIVSVQVASAADIPIKAPVYKAPVMAPVTGWSGFYAGANAGYGWDPSNAIFNPSAFATTLLGPLGGPFVDTGPDSGPVALRVRPKGWLGGGQFGYNWQQNALVYGFEADFDFSGMKASASAPFFVNGTEGGDLAGFTGNVRLQQKLDYFGTVRGRLGWANDNVLLYGTGGAAWGQVRTTFNTFGVMQNAPGMFTAAQLAAIQAGGYATASDTRFGFAVGAGAEWKVASNWSVKAEYLFVELSGSQTLTIPGGVATAGNLPVQVARVGVNYFFRP
jgi:outer membrane immunogenic protein